MYWARRVLWRIRARGWVGKEEEADEEDSEGSDYEDDAYGGVERLQIRRTGQGLRVRELSTERDDSGTALDRVVALARARS